MPESKGRDAAEAKKKSARKASGGATRAKTERTRPRLGENRAWVVPTFVTLMLVGVLWLVVWYLTASAGIIVPVMSELGNWNMLVAMVAMAGSFAVATLWK